MSGDLRDRIAEALNGAIRYALSNDGTTSGPLGMRDIADAVMAVVQPDLDRLQDHVDDVLGKLDAEKSCACSWDAPEDMCVGHSPGLKKALQRAENAERERDVAVAAADPFKIERVKSLTAAMTRLVTAERDDARKCADKARALLRELVDPDDCHFDHNGFCQAHGFSPPCPHAQAKTLLADHPEDP